MLENENYKIEFLIITNSEIVDKHNAFAYSTFAYNVRKQNSCEMKFHS